MKLVQTVKSVFNNDFLYIYCIYVAQFKVCLAVLGKYMECSAYLLLQYLLYKMSYYK